MKNNGFTTAELLIVLMIVGILSVLMITSIRPQEKHIKYAYTNTFSNLNRTVYNIKQDANKAAEEGGATVDTMFPLNEKELCKKLTAYLNTQTNNCGAFNPVSKNSTDQDFNDAAVAFTTSNSMKYYISTMTYYIPPGNAAPIIYYIAWVDLNGNRRPNTIAWDNTKAADIVPYIITINGDVVPAGYPTVDKRYMSSRVEIANNIETTYSQSMSFYEAQKIAYNSKMYPNIDNMSIDFSKAIGGNLAIDAKVIPPVGASNPSCSSTKVYMPCSVVINEFNNQSD